MDMFNTVPVSKDYLPDIHNPSHRSTISITCRSDYGPASHAPSDYAQSVVVVMHEDDRDGVISVRGMCWAYFRKFRGHGLDSGIKRNPQLDMFFSWLGAFLGILLVACLNHFLTPEIDLPLIVASLGASAVLIFGLPEAPLAQPRNFIGGQVLSAIVGCAVRLVLKDVLWLSAAVGVSLAIVAMKLTSTAHPPGGATALIAASVQHLAPWAGFQFALTVLLSSLSMLVVAVLVNNLSPTRCYPTKWW